ncbi:hypothetical protein DPMN_057008 [Dreissena polymorpha]|uniref:Uncharacterized protein n=1 Tax=Dreissena polymorpha TaxID=45954 RepID=A0A9D4HTS2_DREPO|nr:hypothetical protein DPMN_057008 [Dreissena polymorpha]
MAKDKQYAIDTTMAISTLKKKTVYNTQVSVRTPTQEVLAFGGDLGITYGEKLDFNIALDKIVDKKVTLKGEMCIYI